MYLCSFLSCSSVSCICCRLNPSLVYSVSEAPTVAGSADESPSLPRLQGSEEAAEASLRIRFSPSSLRRLRSVFLRKGGKSKNLSEAEEATATARRRELPEFLAASRRGGFGFFNLSTLNEREEQGKQTENGPKGETLRKEEERQREDTKEQIWRDSRTEAEEVSEASERREMEKDGERSIARGTAVGTGEEREDRARRFEDEESSRQERSTKRPGRIDEEVDEVERLERGDPDISREESDKDRDRQAEAREVEKGEDMEIPVKGYTRTEKRRRKNESTKGAGEKKESETDRQTSRQRVGKRPVERKGESGGTIEARERE